jgi:hypothetical protein
MHQQVIFLSDVRDASGRALDKKYLHPRPYGNQWSTLSFPKEDPSDGTFFYGKKHFSKSEHLGGDSNLALTSG